MTDDRIISALIGLVGAVSNNGKTEQTDVVVREALLHRNDPTMEESLVQKIHELKNVIAPDCATCKMPCGNTSDYDMTQFYSADESVLAAKKELLETICTVLTNNEQVTDNIYRGIAYLGYPVTPEDCERIREGIIEQYA